MIYKAVGLVFVAVIFTSYSCTLASPPGMYTMNVTCPDGWQMALNNCYLFNTVDQLTWDEARTECSIKNADLMIIGSKQEQNWITIQTEYYKTDGWWVGLNYKSSWQWVQYGGDTRFIKWRNEPDNYDGQNCDAISEYGLFSDEYCKSKLGFICKYPIQREDTSCPTTTGWFMTDTGCYYISDLLNTTLHLDWINAKTYCKNLLPGKNMQLLSFNDSDDANSFKRLLASFDPSKLLLPWWTGLNDLTTEGKYCWQDGTVANNNIITWDKAPSSDKTQKRNCGIMYQGGSIDDVTCDKRAHYMCEMSAIQGHLNLGCGSWTRGGKSCYLFGKRAKSWSMAKSACNSANAHLVKVDNADERVWLRWLYLGSNGYWTGLNQANGVGPWVWDDNSALQPSMILWSQEPNNAFGQEDCAEIKRDGTYNDRQCNAKIGYACEYVAGYGKSCLPGWTSCQSSCIYISAANDNLTFTWYEAAQRCSDMVSSNGLTGYRLAVNDKTEQACVNKMLQQLPPGAPGHWTELSDLDFKTLWQYKTAANNPPNYKVIPWAREPNNFNNSEHCALMYQGGYYNDLNCAAKAFFICERELALSTSTVTLPSTLLLMVAIKLTLILK